MLGSLGQETRFATCHWKPPTVYFKHPNWNLNQRKKKGNNIFFDQLSMHTMNHSQFWVRIPAITPLRFNSFRTHDNLTNLTIINILSLEFCLLQAFKQDQHMYRYSIYIGSYVRTSRACNVFVNYNNHYIYMLYKVCNMEVSAEDQIMV